MISMLRNVCFKRNLNLAKKVEENCPEKFFFVVDVATKSGRKLTRKVAILVMLQ